jgi:uncharacterized Tic20 family protein
MIVPFGHIIGPLAVYLAQRQRSAFVTAHAKASLNFQITISVVALFLAVVAAAAAITLFGGPNGARSPASGFPIVLAVWLGCLTVFLLGAVTTLFLMVQGALAADRGLPYRYPLTITFVR